MARPLVAIIILNWNGLEDTIECLESLRTVTYTNYKTIVVDNGSDGDDVRILKEKYGDSIYIIENSKNYGYTGGNNKGITYAQHHYSSDYYLIMNNDVTVAPDFLEQLVSVTESDNSIGIVGPKVYFRNYPNVIQSAGGKINMWTGQISFAGARQMDKGRYDKLQEKEIVSGCFFLIRQEVVKNIGLFDEDYFCYWEDVDFCLRASQQGYKIIYEPLAKVWHSSPLRLKAWQRLAADNKAGGFIYYYTVRNNFRFMRKHATRAQFSIFIIYFLIYRFWFMSAVSLLYYRSMKRFIGVCHGLKDGLNNTKGSEKYYRPSR